MHTGTLIADLVETVAKRDGRDFERHPATGRCEIELENGVCGAVAHSFCRDCHAEICFEHQYMCCVEVYGACCIGSHVCAIKAAS